MAAGICDTSYCFSEFIVAAYINASTFKFAMFRFKLLQLDRVTHVRLPYLILNTDLPKY